MSDEIFLDDTGLSAATAQLVSRGQAAAARTSRPIVGSGADPVSAAIMAGDTVDAPGAALLSTQLSAAVAALEAARLGTITILDGADAEGGAGIDAVGQGGGAVAPSPGVVLV